MTEAAEIRQLWLSVQDIAGPIADLRDRYVSSPGLHNRFSQLYDVWRNLLEIEQALFEFLEIKKPLLGSKPEKEMLVVARASLANAKILLDIASAEFAQTTAGTNAQN